MEKKFVREEIIELLEVIVEQSEVISNYRGLIPQIEIDIVLSNIREIYDKYKVLEKLNKQNNGVVVTPEEKPKIEYKSEPITQAPLIEEPKIIPAEPPAVVEEIKEKEIVVVQESAALNVLPVEEKTENEEAKLPEEKPEKVQELPSKKIKIKTPSVDLFSSHSTIADKFRDDKKSLNEKHSSSQTGNSIASKLQKNPIKDLKSAIGINEKFKFINELFEGNLQKYNENITKLNEFGGYEEALKYLDFLNKEFTWKQTSDAYHEIKELVMRRYL